MDNKVEKLDQFLNLMNYRYDGTGYVESMVDVDTRIASIASKVVKDPTTLEDIELFGSMSREIDCGKLLHIALHNAKKQDAEARQFMR